MFKKRLSPGHFKTLTEKSPVQRLPLPGEIVLPLLQHAGKPAVPTVLPGDKVKTGALVAQAEGAVSAPVHSSICGRVKAIEKQPHPVLGEYKAVVIEAEGEEQAAYSAIEEKDVDRLSPAEIKETVRSCGIVGLGGAAFPTHIKLSPPQGKTIDTFILNGAECEPFLTADHRLMLEKPGEIIKGMQLAMRALGVRQGYAAVEKNKPDAIAALRKSAAGRDIKVIELESFYPQGAEKQIIKTILRREAPPGGLPYDVGVVVQNAATCFAIYEAVYYNKPLYEKVITVTGKIVRNPGNYQARIGTRVREIIAACGGLSEEPAKVILGGPMMGLAQWTLDVPVIKGTAAVLVLGEKEVREHAAEPCIRCGRCIQVCPMRLNPSVIAQAAAKDRWDIAREYNVGDCVECGICAYVCPGRRNMVELIKLAKQKLK